MKLHFLFVGFLLQLSPLAHAGKAFLTCKEARVHHDLNKRLLEAAKNGSLEGVKETIAAGADVNYQNNDGIFTLKSTYLSFLLTIFNEQELSIESAQNWTPLMHAVSHQHVEIIEFLLMKNANVDVFCFDYYGSNNPETALSLAVKRGDNKIIKLLISNIKNRKTITHAYSINIGDDK